MIFLPAVDIRDGKAVRLRQGDFDQETVYADDPLEAARSFVEAGARFLHLVDLDGARQGEPANLHHVERIASERIGRETVTYVSNIYKYYIAYRLLSDQQQRRIAAKDAIRTGK